MYIFKNLEAFMLVIPPEGQDQVCDVETVDEPYQTA